jgi:hypothetical protein
MKKLTIRINLDRYLEGAMLDGEITIKTNSTKKLSELYEKILNKLCPPID